MSDQVELTLCFEPPVTAEDFQERFEELADAMEGVGDE